MTESATPECPVKTDIDRRKTAGIASRHLVPNDGAHWVQNSSIARRILRSDKALQAGASAEFLNYKNPEHAPVFFLDGKEHAAKRQKTQRFLSPKAVTQQHFRIMEKYTHELLADFRQRGEANLEDISFDLAIEVVGEILGLTNSEQRSRAKRIQRVLYASIAKEPTGLRGVILNLKRLLYTSVFYWCDVRPAIKARRQSPREDALSFYLEEGYSMPAIVIECLTYGTAGMLTTREFIVMVAWYLFEDDALRERFLTGDMREQMAILMEILRLEPVGGAIYRRVHEEIEWDAMDKKPSGELYGIDVRAVNVDEAMVGECPFAVDPDRAKRVKDNGRYLSFSDGPHGCPGWQVALHETRIFLDQLFRIPGLTLERAPDVGWNETVGGYELRNARISCEKT